MTLAFFFGASFARQGRPFYDGKHGLMSYPTDAHVGEVFTIKKEWYMWQVHFCLQNYCLWFFVTTSN